ncbi:MAG: archease [Candidatus Binatia bacterium]
MNQKNYTVLKRTSDLSIRVQGKTQAELLSNSASALFDLMTDLEKVQVRENLPLEVEGVDRDDLIVNWIRELLYLFQGSGYLLKEFKIQEARDDYVRAEVSGEKYHPDSHEIQREIRSLIYQQCRMEKTGDQWLARLSFEV